MKHLFTPTLIALTEIATTGKPSAKLAELKLQVEQDLIVKYSTGSSWGLRPNGRKMLAEAFGVLAKAMQNQVKS